MAEKMKVLAPDATGKLSETIGENMDIVEFKEPWSEYILEDETTDDACYTPHGINYASFPKYCLG